MRIAYCLNVKKYLSKYQYPEDCPVKGCTKRLGPQEITRHLNSIDKIRYEAFSLLRSGQMNRLQIMWCYKCRLIFAKKKNKDQICTKCNEISYCFQDALKFLELGNVRTNLTESQNKERKRLDKMFIEDCKGVVERCSICLRRKARITGYKYPLCICDNKNETNNENKDAEENKSNCS